MPELTADAEQLLLAYTWPGNVRELRNLPERLVLRDLGRPVGPDDLRSEVRDNTMSPAAAPRTPLPGHTPEAVREAEHPAAGAQPVYAVTPMVDRLWNKLMAGEDFWTVVQRPFRAHELTRSELMAIVDRGLQRTRGSYRAVVKAFNLPPTDYKRFHAFLYQQNANLPVGPYRHPGPRRPQPRLESRRQAAS